ncbi:LamG domain-containing protein [Spirilliplanes yamanashiensis]|uniref:LamG domain-containing protein n=1 Tax=Spirilliplanes yamanashiensis TaxID=42233 RepID=UPI001950CD9B|nr:LamG domain-containing protein [Spirilliplanes yamanashiensis]MDP9819875.1 hypothetical protein [Spirilliplanes yamanashiensis]
MPALAVLGGPPALAAARAAAVDCRAEAPTEAAAEQMAARCATRVEVADARSELTQVFVEPSGLRTLEAAVTPQRVRKADGSWAKVSTVLRRLDGVVAPEAAAADVTFSNGGTGPFVTWRSGGTTFTLSWEGELRPPRLDGATAIYDEVRPGVALHVTALADGFRHALEVRSADAAGKTDLRTIQYKVGGNAVRRVTEAGAVELVDGSGDVFATTAGASMWDSTSAAGGVAVLRRAVPGVLDEDLRSDGRRAGAAAKVNPVDVRVSGDVMTVEPDMDMLASPDTVYPVFIDPPFNGKRSKWAWANKANKDWDVEDRAWVGRNPFDGVLYRSFFDFDVSSMRGATVLDAHMAIKLDHSFSCDDSWAWLYRTDKITVDSGKRMNWGTRPLPGTQLDSWAGHANEAGGCGKIQPDADAVFDAAAVKNDLHRAVNASAGWQTYTVGLCACNPEGDYESAEDRWKKFFPNTAYLVATYDKAPNRPTPEALSKTTDCYKACTSPAVVRSVKPTLKAGVSDPYKGNLRTTFEVRTAASATATLVSSGTVTDASGTSAEWTVAASLANGSTYYWRAQSKDENNLTGDWSAWQTLVVDTTPPTGLVVTSDEYPYKAWGASVDTKGTFAFTGATGAADYTWSVDQGAATQTAQASAVYTPTKDMVRTMRVVATDVAGNKAPEVVHQFWVSPLPNRCWNWRLDESSGTTAADLGNTDAADPVCGPLTGATVQAQPGTLSGAVSFGPGYLGNAASFTGLGQIQLGGPVLNSRKSFTVMAWVRPADLAAGPEQAVLSQDGEQTSRFALMYRKDANGGAGGWCFVLRDTDTGGTGPTMACATGEEGSSARPAANAWVHLGGVYDAAANRVQIHVMGNQESCDGEMVSAPAGPAWEGGSFVIGRGKAGGAAAHHWRGSIDQVYAHQRVLSAFEICQQAIQ